MNAKELNELTKDIDVAVPVWYLDGRDVWRLLYIDVHPDHAADLITGAIKRLLPNYYVSHEAMDHAGCRADAPYQCVVLELKSEDDIVGEGDTEVEAVVNACRQWKAWKDGRK